MKYLGAMLLAFASGAFQLATAARLAANAGLSVTAWLGVYLLGLSIFFLVCIMGAVSVREEAAVSGQEWRHDS